jgi:cytochrome c-type biogenesis protein
MLAFGLEWPCLWWRFDCYRARRYRRWRGQLLSAEGGLKFGLGQLPVIIGALVLTSFDKTIETVLVDASPSG